jgi:hypothetical protein
MTESATDMEFFAFKPVRCNGVFLLHGLTSRSSTDPRETSAVILKALPRGRLSLVVSEKEQFVFPLPYIDTLAQEASHGES